MVNLCITKRVNTLHAITLRFKNKLSFWDTGEFMYVQHVGGERERETTSDLCQATVLFQTKQKAEH